MGFKNEMTNEELKQVAGGFVPWLEEIISPVGNETPNFIGKARPIIPVPGEPGKEESAEFILP